MISPAAEEKITALGLSEEQVYRALRPDLLLPLASISPNPENPKQCNDARLLALTSALLQDGWVPSELPLVWETPDGKPTQYQLINGEHRWLICQAAGFEKFPAVIAPTIHAQADATALCMRLEEARARRDSKQFTANLLEMAAQGRDVELREVLRIKDPEALRAQRERFANKLKDTVEAGGIRGNAPRLVSLTFTGAQYEAYQVALGNARTRLKQAAETIAMLEELADSDVIAIGAVLRNGSS